MRARHNLPPVPRKCILMPSLENANELTQLLWQVSTFSFAPVDAPHTRTVLSYKPIRIPSLENATELTHWVALQHIQLCTGRRIPHPHSLIIQARHNPHPVPRKRNSFCCSPSGYRHQRHLNPAFRMNKVRDPRELGFPVPTEFRVLCPCC
jgi:hypothetical protein